MTRSIRLDTRKLLGKSGSGAKMAGPIKPTGGKPRSAETVKARRS
jgi:hypothetical protein